MGVVLGIGVLSGTARAADDPVLLPKVQPGPLTSLATDGPVFAMAQSGNQEIIGGQFTHIGPMSGGGVQIDPVAGTVPVTFPRVEGIVFTALPDGAGGVYIGGAFGAVGTIKRVNVAHIKADGSVDIAFNANTDAPVEALTLVGNHLWVGGSFTHIKNAAKRRLAAVDPATGNVYADISPDPDGRVRDLATDGTEVFASGEFKGFGGKSRNSLAALDGQTGTLDPNFDLSFDGEINALLVSDGKLYIGGEFANIGGRSRSNLAAINIADGSINRDFSPASNGRVNALALSQGRLLVAGEFGEIAGQQHRAIAALDPASGAALNFNVPIDGDVYTLYDAGSRIIAGGNFDRVGGKRIVRIVALNPADGSVDPTLAPDPDGDVYALAPMGATVFAGGEFTSFPRTIRTNIAAIDLTTGQLNPNFHPLVDGIVDVLKADGTKVYAGGTFKNVDGKVHGGIAAFDLTAGGLDTTFDAQTDGTVHAIVKDGASLIIGGGFSKVDQDKRRSIARVDASTGARDTKWPALGGPRRYIDGTVHALYAVGKRLFVAGSETGVTDKVLHTVHPKHGKAYSYYEDVTRRSDLFALAKSSGRLDRAFSVDIDGDVVSLSSLPDGSLLAGGSYYASEYTGRKNRYGEKLYKYYSGLVSFGPRGAVHKGFSAETSDAVNTVVMAGDRLLVGGGFNVIGGTQVCGLASLDPSTGDVDPAYFPRPRGQVDALLAQPDRVLVGGAFEGFGLGSQYNLGGLPLAVPPTPDAFTTAPAKCDIAATSRTAASAIDSRD